jgi:AbrB family looped-hinge helix DNA binding protein
MEKTRLSSKGQIIIPKAVRDAHGWTEGTEFTVEGSKDAIVLRPQRTSLFPRTTIDDVIGCVNYKGPRKSIKEMNDGIVKEARLMWQAFETQAKKK